MNLANLVIITATAVGPMSWAQQLTITQQPASQSVSLGANVLLQVTASPAPLVYQWRLDGSDLLNATNRALSVANAQLINAGAYQVVVANSSGSITSRVANLDVDPTFTKITVGTIVTDLGSAIGCAWGDYNNDGFVDLIVTILSEGAPSARQNLLFQNKGDGTFTKVTANILTAAGADWRGCAWGDYNNDGNLDLFITSTDQTGFPGQNELFQGNANGSFTKMAKSSAGDIVTFSPGGSEGCISADYDNDGLLDMFIARYGNDLLYHNTGEGYFVSVTNNLAGLNTEDSYWAAWGDYNNDGRPDLFVTVKSDPATNRLYLNLGGGSFARVTSGRIATDSAHSFGCAWADYDNDGNLDLFVCNGGYVANEANALYHNNGDGTFTRMPSQIVGSIANDTGPFLSCAWGDYDNDGFLDVFVTTLGSSPGVNFLYHNNGNGSFTRILRGSLANDKGIAGGCAWGDYDNDGFLDLFVARGSTGVADTDLLYRNTGNSNAWLKVNLVGTVSNRSAIGAKVHVRATIRGNPIWQLREINSGNGMSQGPLVAHFGLGDATNADIVRIEWPSGIAQSLTNVPARQILTVTEHQLSALNAPNLTASSFSTTDGSIRLSSSGDTGLLYLFEGSTNLVNWAWLGVRSNATGSVEFRDLHETNYTRRFYRVSVP